MFDEIMEVTYLRLWQPQWGPTVVGALLASGLLIVGIGLAKGLWSMGKGVYIGFQKERRKRAFRRIAEKEKRDAEAVESLRRETEEAARREDMQFREWANAESLKWRQLLYEKGEKSLNSRIEAIFADRKDGESRFAAERRCLCGIQELFVTRAVEYSRENVADPEKNKVKIHLLVGHAVNIAKAQNSWPLLQTVPDAVRVVSPFVLDQPGLCMPDPEFMIISLEFLDFMTWILKSASSSPHDTIVAP